MTDIFHQSAPRHFVGRSKEKKYIFDLIANARDGQGGTLVLRGDAGIGKTALLEHAGRSAPHMRVIRASGDECEQELPFSALHQFCRPILPHLADIPAPYRTVLHTAFGLVEGTSDLLRVGAATLELLSYSARDQALLCLIDDAQWIDSASLQVLTFLARRVNYETVAMLFATRPVRTQDRLESLPGLPVGALSDTDATELLATRRLVTFDDRVRQRILLEARGNPLALLEMSPPEEFALPGASTPNRITRGYQDRLADVPAGARLLMTVASADPTGDPGLLWSAARHLNIELAAATAAATATELIAFSTKIQFCHPLARSTVYLAASAEKRRLAHRVLAEFTDANTAPDRRAWHRAHASTGPNEDIAADLEASAQRAQARGGVAAMAAFLERAVALSLDPYRRTERTLAAVRAYIDAGDNDAAQKLLTGIEGIALDEHQAAQADVLRGRMAFLRHEDGTTFMLRAVQRLAHTGRERSGDFLLDAVEASVLVGRDGDVLNEMPTAMRSEPSPRTPDLLDGLAQLSTGGHRSAYPQLRRALDDGDTPMWIRWPALSAAVAGELWDPHAQVSIAQQLVRTGRELRLPLLLRLGLAQTACNAALCGDLKQAAAAIEEEEALADALGGSPVTYHRLHLAAMRGRRREAVRLLAPAAAAAVSSGGQHRATVHWAEAVLYNGLGDYPAALAAACHAAAHGDLYVTGLSLPELLEAAVRCGERDTAARVLSSLTDRTEASGTRSGLGIAAYARGLFTGKEDHYREAVEHLGASPLIPYRARAHLLYGEWLRRENRRREGRQQLRMAYDLLTESGAEAFARRARDELRATGEQSQRRVGALTSQELHVARLVAAGATSKEVAGALMLSTRTIDAHLRNIFRKLGVTSRRQLKNHAVIGD
ncbi:LuxR family transcriptional regulator [Streptomyces sp. NPDC047070]|uniref:LuxR family transcriptional regulator n=1 Tax=Streptomyces sp. NPDC047070 TaxID=3154923 RepID=UPI0034572EB4